MTDKGPRVRSFLLHTTGTLIGQAGGVISVSALAAIGGLELLGEISLDTAAGVFLSSVSTASLALAANVIVAREHGVSLIRARQASRHLLLLGWCGSLAAAIITFFASLIWDESHCPSLAFACAAYCALASANTVQVSILRGFGDFKTTSLLAVSDGVLKFALLIPFAWESREPVQFILAMTGGQAASNMIYRLKIMSLTNGVETNFSEFKDRHMSEVSRFVSSNMPSNILVAAFNWICVWAIGSFSSPAEAGKWSIGQRLINVMTFLPQRYADVNLTHLSKHGHGTHAEAWKRGLRAAGLCIFLALPILAAGTILNVKIGGLSDALDAQSLTPFALVAALMLLVRFRVQHDFSKLRSTNETRAAIVRVAVLILCIIPMSWLGVISSDSVAYVRALSYAGSAVLIFITEK